MPRRLPPGPPDPIAPAAPEACVLCGRPLGRRIEQHHLVPKSRGGRETSPIHPVCHRAIHAALSNQELARDYREPSKLREHPGIARFLAWIADKSPDFHAPVRRRTHEEERRRLGRKHG